MNRLAILGLVFVALAGCATRTGPPLRMEALEIDQTGLIAEKHGRVNWQIVTSGGQGERSYQLLSLKQGIESLEYSGPLALESWQPNKPGIYQLRGVAADETGRRVMSGWSEPLRVAPALSRDSLYAVLPIENLSDNEAPLADIQTELRNHLTAMGFTLLREDRLDTFMEQQRMRYTGGLNNELSRQFKDQTQVDGVVLTTLETWQTSSTPRVSLIMRLVLTGDTPEILWMDSVGLTGADAPGLFNLGWVDDINILLNRAFEQLLGSLQHYLDGAAPEYRHNLDSVAFQLLNKELGTADGSLKPVRKGHQPQFSYRASFFNPTREYRVAVVPFININARKHAEKILTLHLVKQLQRYDNLRVFEPGVIRDTLLRYRMIMQAGPSLAASDILSSESILGADLVISGQVFDFQDEVGTSKIDFSIQAFDGSKREVIWNSRTYANGDQGVFFYDWKQIFSADELASRMIHAAVRQMYE